MYIHAHTERLLIRPIALQDNQFLHELMQTEGWQTYIGDRGVRNAQNAEAYIGEIRRNQQFFYHLMLQKDTQTAVGVLTFLKRDAYEAFDLGFALLPKYQGQGLAFEASSHYLQLLANAKQHGKVLAITLVQNTASIRLLEKLGFLWQQEHIEDSQRLALYARSLL
jgi:[ribosomal protein S5]-alanine N-acetyltransferase